MRKFLLASLTALAVMAMTSAQASTFKVIYAFCQQADCTDGQQPNGVIADAGGNIYGTTRDGGQNNAGTVFELQRKKGAWKQKVLYSFCAQPSCTDGSAPMSTLILDTGGNLYGTTFGGQSGTVFELVKPTTKKKWTLKTLAAFCTSKNCQPAFEPEYGLSYAGASSGALYDGTSPLFGVANGGTTTGKCQPECGTVFELSLNKKSKWVLKTIYEFCAVQFSTCPDGSRPIGELYVDAQGNNLVGAAGADGNTGLGALFKLTRSGSSWSESILYGFCATGDCPDGANPSYGVTVDGQGNLLGMTQDGGGAPNGGVLYKITPGATVKEQTVYTFCQAANCADGQYPQRNGVIIDSAGNLFGATAHGGGNNIDIFGEGGGTLFSVIGGTFHSLYGFCAQANCADGEYPTGQIVFGSGGTILGATEAGGPNAAGEIYELTP